MGRQLIVMPGERQVYIEKVGNIVAILSAVIERLGAPLIIRGVERKEGGKIKHERKEGQEQRFFLIGKLKKNIQVQEIELRSAGPARHWKMQVAEKQTLKEPAVLPLHRTRV